MLVPLRLAALLLSLSFCQLSVAALLLARGETTVAPNELLTVTVVNLDDDTPLPDTLLALIHFGERSIKLELRAQSAAQPGVPRREFAAVVPGDAQGLGTLELADRPSSRLLVSVEKPVPVSTDPLPRMMGRRAQEAEGVPEKLPALTAHEPTYFLVGTRESNTARFQISFKYRLFDEEGKLVEWLPLLAGLRFGYTQTSLWDLQGRSKPFRDSSYRPSLFYQWGHDILEQPAVSKRFVQAGFEHESNGRDGDRSRSINIVFVRPTWRIPLNDIYYVGISPKLYTYLDKSENQDIAHYRGYTDLGLRFGRDDGWLFSSILRRGTGGFGSMQLDASYPLKRPFLADAGGFIHLQYFNGYGETLLDYNVRRKPQFRVGFSIVR